MEYWLESIVLYLIIIFCLFLTILNLMGNLWLITAAAVYAVYNNFTRFDEMFLFYLFLVFAVGELWEFVVGFLGIKRKNVSWVEVFFIGLGTIFGVIVGTGVMPILGSVVGGSLGACATAFTIEYMKNKSKKDAWHLARLAFKTQLLAALGKITAGVVMACMMVLQLSR